MNEKGFKTFVSLILDKLGPIQQENQLALKELFIAGNEISLFEF